MKKYKYIVIGGGVSGIISAIFVSSNGIKTAIIEKNKKLGRKLLLAGAGQCNITHTGSIDEFLTKYGKNYRFLKPALYNFSPQDLMDFYQNNGLELYTREDGKIFPKSKKSGDVLTHLYHLCNKYNVDIFVENSVLDVFYDKNLGSFCIKTNQNMFNSDYLMIATGGITYKQTGSTGDGYNFAENFGHNIINPKPSLSPIFIENYPFEDISGVSFKNILVKILNKNNKLISSLKDDLLLTHQNLSGPVILNLSRYAEKDFFVEINFISKDKEEARLDLINEQQKNGKKLLRKYLKKYSLPENFILKILSLLKIDKNIQLHEINKNYRENLINYLTNYKNKIIKIAPTGMTTAGGIDLKEVNPKTMESKLIPNLFFAGEILDIDGDTGGYSIQAAHSTSILASKSIINKVKS